MIRYLTRSVVGQIRRAKSLYLLTVCGVALGVASVLSIQIINRNALAAFRGSVQAVSGDIDLSILGRTPVFPESLLVEVLGTAGVDRAWPMYRLAVAVRERPDLFLDVVGVELFQPVDLPLDSLAGAITDALTERGWIAVTPSLAAAQGWAPGDRIAVSSGSRVVELVVGALVDFQRATPLAGTKLAVMDVAQAQGLFGLSGMISQIDVRLLPDADREAVAADLRATLGTAVDVLTPEQRERRASGLMSAFRLNLTALSLISLFVGLFLIFSATQASLTRRRAEFGVLRSLGATRGQVLGLILAEVAVLGALGVALGLPLGLWLASANVDVVSATLTNLYLLNEIEQLRLPPWLYALAAAIGIGGAVIGAVGPAVDMSRRDPKALLSAFTLHERLRTAALPLAGAGIAVLVTTSLWFAIAGRAWQPAGFVLAVGLLIGLPLCTPLAVRLLTSSFRARDFGVRYSIRSLGVRLQSTSIAVAALAIAVSMLTGITVMVGSFRRTVEVWIDSTVRADVYITSESWVRSSAVSPLDSPLVQRLSQTRGVVGVDRLRSFFGYNEDRRISVVGVDIGAALPAARFEFYAGDPDTALARMLAQDAVLISEPLARKADRWVGDTLDITGPNGVLSFPIGGVYYDYSSEAGTAVMDLRTLNRRFGDGPISNVALYLDPSIDAERFVDGLRADYHDTPLLFRSNAVLRREVLQIFDQTFAITRILQAMSLLIAASGITLTLLIIARERVSELSLYRALGAARRQIFLVFVGKGTAMGFLGLALGATGGLALAAILILVINRAYFGWTIQVFWPWGPLAGQAATIAAVTVAASVYPALRASRTPARELSREDL